MPDLARSNSPRTRVLLVRQPVRSVRHHDQPSRTPTRLAVGVIAAFGTIGLLWLMGIIGFHLGFARLLGVPALLTPPGGGLLTSIIMLENLPATVIAAGVAQPIWLMIAFAVVAIPAAGLSVAAPLQPGGPGPSTLARTFSVVAAVAVGLFLIGVFAWVLSPLRMEMINPLPSTTTVAAEWIAALQAAAGFDWLLTIAAALWIVLTFRLPIERWLRALIAVAAIVAFAVAACAVSMTAGAAAHMQNPHALITSSPQSESPALLLGHTRDRAVHLRVNDETLMVTLTEPSSPQTNTVIDQRSIIELMEQSTQ